MRTTLFIVLAMFFCPVSLACRCDSLVLQGLIKNPKSAATSFTGLYKAGTFDVEKSRQKITIENKNFSKCDVKLIDGEKYKILSINKLSIPMIISVCDTIAIPINYPASNCQTWHKQWGICRTDSDCVVISNPCGWPVSSANKIFSEKAQDCNRIEGTALSCATWNEVEGGKRVSKCQTGLCVNQRLE